MEELKVKPIPTRKWDKDMEDWELLVEFDKNRKKSQESVSKRIYYMHFKYLQLCLNLEEINYSVKKKGAKGKVLGEIFVKVNRKIYKDWNLNSLHEMSFHEWYKDQKHQLLFTEGGFKPQSRARYSSLVKRFNCFIEYYNGMNREFYNRGDISQEMQVCSDIIEKYQKVRFERVKKDVDSKTSTYTELVKKDLKQCGKEILYCCNGEFPKSK